uniref:Uncharacterized protein n=1 Tax=Rhodnius prolixus TaxID=13249 RepID=T1HY98_RHOPR
MRGKHTEPNFLISHEVFYFTKIAQKYSFIDGGDFEWVASKRKVKRFPSFTLRKPKKKPRRSRKKPDISLMNYVIRSTRVPQYKPVFKFRKSLRRDDFVEMPISAILRDEEIEETCLSELSDDLMKIITERRRFRMFLRQLQQILRKRLRPVDTLEVTFDDEPVKEEKRERTQRKITTASSRKTTPTEKSSITECSSTQNNSFQKLICQFLAETVYVDDKLTNRKKLNDVCDLNSDRSETLMEKKEQHLKRCKKRKLLTSTEQKHAMKILEGLVTDEKLTQRATCFVNNKHSGDKRSDLDFGKKVLDSSDHVKRNVKKKNTCRVVTPVSSGLSILSMKFQSVKQAPRRPVIYRPLPITRMVLKEYLVPKVGLKRRKVCPKKLQKNVHEKEIPVALQDDVKHVGDLIPESLTISSKRLRSRDEKYKLKRFPQEPPRKDLSAKDLAEEEKLKYKKSNEKKRSTQKQEVPRYISCACSLTGASITSTKKKKSRRKKLLDRRNRIYKKDHKGATKSWIDIFYKYGIGKECCLLGLHNRYDEFIRTLKTATKRQSSTVVGDTFDYGKSVSTTPTNLTKPDFRLKMFDELEGSDIEDIDPKLAPLRAFLERAAAVSKKAYKNLPPSIVPEKPKLEPKNILSTAELVIAEIDPTEYLPLSLRTPLTADYSASSVGKESWRPGYSGWAKNRIVPAYKGTWAEIKLADNIRNHMDATDKELFPNKKEKKNKGIEKTVSMIISETKAQVELDKIARKAGEKKVKTASIISRTVSQIKIFVENERLAELARQANIKTRSMEILNNLHNLAALKQKGDKKKSMVIFKPADKPEELKETKLKCKITAYPALCSKIRPPDSTKPILKCDKSLKNKNKTIFSHFYKNLYSLRNISAPFLKSMNTDKSGAEAISRDDVLNLHEAIAGYSFDHYHKNEYKQFQAYLEKTPKIKEKKKAYKSSTEKAFRDECQRNKLYIEKLTRRKNRIDTYFENEAEEKEVRKKF